MGKQRLGRGLEALIPLDQASGEQGDGNQGSAQLVGVGLIDPNPYQPRREFDHDKLHELAVSIRTHGIIQPVVLRQLQGRYQLVAGERRLRAAKLAGLSEVPALVQDYNDTQMLELSIVENLQRDDLNAIEEALAYQQLGERLELTQEQMAQRVGRSRSHVANTVRLLQLSPTIQRYVSRETLSAGHARTMIGLTPAQQLDIAERVMRLGLSVRQTEQLVKQMQTPNVSRETQRPPEPQLTDIERRLQSSLGTNVKVIGGQRNGKIEISFFSASELERLLELLLQQG